uniref:Uncharacterized protein n=1 Tax=Glossina austeni TaxID=7395 RepID=A0A1A9UT23_GLOAU
MKERFDAIYSEKILLILSMGLGAANNYHKSGTTFDENSILNSKNANRSNCKGLPMNIVLLLFIPKSIPQRSYKFGDLGPGVIIIVFCLLLSIRFLFLTLSSHFDCMTQLYI